METIESRMLVNERFSFQEKYRRFPPFKLINMVKANVWATERDKKLRQN